MHDGSFLLSIMIACNRAINASFSRAWRLAICTAGLIVHAAALWRYALQPAHTGRRIVHHHLRRLHNFIKHLSNRIAILLTSPEMLSFKASITPIA